MGLPVVNHQRIKDGIEHEPPSRTARSVASHTPTLSRSSSAGGALPRVRVGRRTVRLGDCGSSKVKRGTSVSIERSLSDRAARARPSFHPANSSTGLKNQEFFLLRNDHHLFTLFTYIKQP